MGLFSFLGGLLGLSGGPNRKIELQKVSAAAGLPIIYGERRLEPITVLKVVSRKNMPITNAAAYDHVYNPSGHSYDKEYDENNWLNRIDVWGQGEISAIRRFWVDGDSHTAARFNARPYFRAMSKYGSETQTAASELALGHSDWTTGHKGLGVAYTWSRFYASSKKPQFDAEPELTALVKGIRVYDPRDSGQNPAVPSTWAYSNNRALVVLNYLMSSFGLNAPDSDIDFNSFAVAADLCDTDMDIPARPINLTGAMIYNYWHRGLGDFINIDIGAFFDDQRPDQIGTTQPLYTADAILDPKDGVVKNTKKLLEGMGWSLPWSNGKHKLILEAAVAAPVMSFDENSIIGGWSVERGKRSDRLNRVTIEFPNANKEYEKDTVSWPELGSETHNLYKTQDNEQDLHTNVSLETVTDFYRAQAYAEFMVRKSRVSPFIAGLELAPKAMLLEPGDVIALTYVDKGFNNSYFIVDAVHISADLEVQVDLTKYDPTVYGAPALLEEPIANSPYNPDLWLDPPMLADLELTAQYETNADGSVISGVLAAWSAPVGGPTVASVEISWKKSSDSDYAASMILTAGSTSAIITGLVDDESYDVSVTYTTQRGVQSDPAVATLDLAAIPSKLGGIEGGATAGATLGSNLYDEDGIVLSSDQIVTADGQIVFDTVWNFGPDVKGWTGVDITLSSNNTGIVIETLTSNSQLISPGSLAIDGSRWNKVVVRLKRLSVGDGDTWEGPVLFYTTASHSFSHSYKKYANARFVNNTYSTFVFDMENLIHGGDDWSTHTITQLRFDPTQTSDDQFEIDWIGVGKVAPSMAIQHGANLVSDYGLKKFDLAETAEEIFAAKTLDAMGLIAGNMISASLQIYASGARRGRLTLRFVNAGGTVLPDTEVSTPWSTQTGQYHTVEISGLLIPVGTDKIRGVFERETGVSGEVAARGWTINRGPYAVPYAPIRDDVEEAATKGAVLGQNVTDAHGIIIDDNEVRSADSQLDYGWYWNFGPDTKGWTGSDISISAVDTGIRITTLSNDSQLFSPTGLSIDGRTYDKVTVRLKRVTAGDGETWEGPILYYATLGHGISSSYRKFANARFVAGNYATFTFDMANLSAGGDDWKNSIITQLRFDPTYTSEDDFEIDWIAVGRVAPAFVATHAVNLVSDLGLKTFTATNTDSDEVFAAKTLDTMNIKAGDQISASLDVYAGGARRGQLKIDFLNISDSLISSQSSPWSSETGSYQTLRLEGVSIPSGTNKIRGSLIRENSVSGTVGARFFSLNRGAEAVPYAPIRSDVEEGANQTTSTSQLTDDAELGKKAIWSNVSGTGKPEDGATNNIGVLADLDVVDTTHVVDQAITDSGTDTDSDGNAVLGAGNQEIIVANVSGVTGWPFGVKLFGSVKLANNLSTRDIAIQIRHSGAGTSTAEVITLYSSNARTFTVTARAKAFSGSRTYELVLRWFGADQDVDYTNPSIEWETAKK